MKRLTELNAQFVDADGRTGVALLFDCPCECGRMRVVPFVNPIDGGEPLFGLVGGSEREGTNLEHLTIRPRLEPEGCSWAGIVADGTVVGI